LSDGPDVYRGGTLLFRSTANNATAPDELLMRWKLDASVGRYWVELGSGSGSAGEIWTGQGLAPLQHWEAEPRMRLQFDRSDLRFRSELPDSKIDGQPISAGVQDRASWLLQLALLAAKAGPEAKVGDTLSIPIALHDRVDTLRFTWAGAESVDTAVGAMTTHRLIAAPAGFAQRIEVWLAPQLHWIPVRLYVVDSLRAVDYQLADFALEN
jgi:hypothetical protein